MARTQQPTPTSKQPPGYAQQGNEDAAQPLPARSDYALSDADGEHADDARYQVAEEQNFDQHSDAARHVGQAPQDNDAKQAMSDATQQNSRSDAAKNGLKTAVNRAIPPSE